MVQYNRNKVVTQCRPSIAASTGTGRTEFESCSSNLAFTFLLVWPFRRERERAISEQLISTPPPPFTLSMYIVHTGFSTPSRSSPAFPACCLLSRYRAFRDESISTCEYSMQKKTPFIRISITKIFRQLGRWKSPVQPQVRSSDTDRHMWKKKISVATTEQIKCSSKTGAGIADYSRKKKTETCKKKHALKPLQRP